MDQAPKTGAARTWALMSMTAGVAGDLVKSRVASLWRDGARGDYQRQAGERIAATLGQLKGAAMKLGQIASMTRELVPPEIVNALQPLQGNAPPMDYAVIESQIESELGAMPERLFARFDREAFAAASIGQVHRAVLDDGREVVVKVQYPGVEAALDADLRQFRRALKIGGLAVDPAAMDDVFEEVRDRLREELDYCNEADNVRLLAGFHAAHSHLVIPEVVAERSSGRVLTLSYEPGEPISVLEQRPMAERVRFASRILEMVLSELFEFGTIHGDPNPANFALRGDQIVVYDFGCVKRHDADTVRAFAELTIAATERDYDRIDRALLSVGARDPARERPPDELYALLVDMMGDALTPGKTFRFDDGKARLEAVRSSLPTLLRHVRSMRPPASVSVIKRVLAGHAETFASLGLRFDVGTIIARYLAPYRNA